MDRPIAKGDLVMVVRPPSCCGSGRTIGKVFVVAKLAPKNGPCKWCGFIGDKGAMLAGEALDAAFGVHLPRLIRIDPPALPESVETTERVPA